MENSNDFDLNLLRLAIEQSPTAIALFDLQTYLVCCSQQWLEDFGVALAEDLQSPLSYEDLIPQIPNQWQESYRLCTQGREARCEAHLFARSDGSSCWMEAKIKPWRNDKGDLCGTIFAAERLSEVEKSDLSWGNVFKLSPDLHAIAGFDGYFKRLNPAWGNLLGYSIEELKEKPFMELVHPDDCEATLEAARQLAEGKPHQAFENRYRHRDGSYRWLQWTAMPLGAEQLIYTVARDITTRKQTEIALRSSESQLRQQTEELSRAFDELRQTQMQLVQTEKMSSLGQLVAGVAHEINNPVNFIYGNLVHAKEYTEDILGLLQLYQQHYNEPVPEIQEEAEAIEVEFLVEDLPQLLSSMMVGANRIKDIVASLRNFSRMDEAEMTQMHLSEGLDSTLTILQNRIKAKPNRPAVAIDKDYEDLPKVECYAGQMNQVFMNIISNALDAIEERDQERSYRDIEDNPSRISLTIRKNDDNTATVCIGDNGPGVPENVRSQLFDPFFTTKPMGKGTGLGLSISAQIVRERHGGRLECQARSDGGTEFIITIPISHTL